MDWSLSRDLFLILILQDALFCLARKWISFVKAYPTIFSLWGREKRSNQAITFYCLFLPVQILFHNLSPSLIIFLFRTSHQKDKHRNLHGRYTNERTYYYNTGFEAAGGKIPWAGTMWKNLSVRQKRGRVQLKQLRTLVVDVVVNKVTSFVGSFLPPLWVFAAWTRYLTPFQRDYCQRRFSQQHTET